MCARLQLLSAGKIVEARDLLIPPASLPEDLDADALELDPVMDNQELEEYLSTWLGQASGEDGRLFRSMSAAKVVDADILFLVCAGEQTPR